MNKSRRKLADKERSSYWFQIINNWESSGKRVNQFCKEHKIGTASFYHWRKQLKPDYPLRTKRSEQHAASQNHFVPVQIKDDDFKFHFNKSAGGVVLYYPNGCFINLGKSFDPQMIILINKAMGL